MATQAKKPLTFLFLPEQLNKSSQVLPVFYSYHRRFPVAPSEWAELSLTVSQHWLIWSRAGRDATWVWLQGLATEEFEFLSSGFLFSENGISSYLAFCQDRQHISTVSTTSPSFTTLRRTELIVWLVGVVISNSLLVGCRGSANGDCFH